MLFLDIFMVERMDDRKKLEEKQYMRVLIKIQYSIK